MKVKYTHGNMTSSEELLKHYEAILNEIEDGVGETDLEGNVTYINDAGCRHWGFSRDELIGSNYRRYVDDDGAKLLRDVYKNVNRTGEPVCFIHHVIRKDGLRILVEDSVSLLRKDDGTVIGYRSVQRNVTEREAAQQEILAHRKRLEAIFGSVLDAIIMVDLHMKVIEANKSTEDICGCPASLLLGQTYFRSSNLCSKKCYDVLNQTLSESISISGHRIECAHVKSHHQVVSINSSPIINHHGELSGAVMVIRDITLIHDLQKELRQRHRFHNIIGRSRKMQAVYDLLDNLTNLDTTVLVTGESGTGKELVAKALHYEGQRALHPLISVSCSALAENLLESELFGHVQGAFTGAVKDKIGRFESAHKGTLLLDEIGDISPVIQLKLLRVLQEKEFERVGESTPRKVDVRVIACTNKDLKKMVAQGQFREDLYYRLKVVQVFMPPLRQRNEDLPLLVDHFIAVFNQRFQKNIEGISQDVIDLFMIYPWPGNVRELEHTLEYAFILCRSTLITLSDLPKEFLETSGQSTQHDVSFQTINKTMDDKKILDALKQTDGNKAKAARLLGIHRRTLYRRLEKLMP